jgi:hypothetical protein
MKDPALRQFPFCKRGKFLHNLYYTVAQMDMDIEINRSSKATP